MAKLKRVAEEKASEEAKQAAADADETAKKARENSSAARKADKELKAAEAEAAEKEREMEREKAEQASALGYNTDAIRLGIYSPSKGGAWPPERDTVLRRAGELAPPRSPLGRSPGGSSAPARLSDEGEEEMKVDLPPGASGDADDGAALSTPRKAGEPGGTGGDGGGGGGDAAPSPTPGMRTPASGNAGTPDGGGTSRVTPRVFSHTRRLTPAPTAALTSASDRLRSNVFKGLERFRFKLNQEAMDGEMGPALLLALWVLALVVSKRSERLVVLVSMVHGWCMDVHSNPTQAHTIPTSTHAGRAQWFTRPFLPHPFSVVFLGVSRYELAQTGSLGIHYVAVYGPVRHLSCVVGQLAGLEPAAPSVALGLVSRLPNTATISVAGTCGSSRDGGHGAHVVSAGPGGRCGVASAGGSRSKSGSGICHGPCPRSEPGGGRSRSERWVRGMAGRCPRSQPRA